MKYPFPTNTWLVPLILLVLIWGTFLLQTQGLGKWECYGVVPRSISGLRGILFAPLFHSGWKHIINNSIPLVVLSFFAVLFYQRMAYYVIILGWILTGVLVWIFGNLPWIDPYVGCHIGASGIVYLLASYVFFSGIFKKSRNLIALSLIVVFLYGSMIWGVIPEDFLPKFYKDSPNKISWEGHLAGGLVGLFFAYITRNHGTQREIYSWELNTEPDEREKLLWSKYKETLSEEERIELEKKYGEEPINDPEKKTNSFLDNYWTSNDTR